MTPKQLQQLLNSLYIRDACRQDQRELTHPPPIYASPPNNICELLYFHSFAEMGTPVDERTDARAVRPPGPPLGTDEVESVAKRTRSRTTAQGVQATTGPTVGTTSAVNAAVPLEPEGGRNPTLVPPTDPLRRSPTPTPQDTSSTRVKLASVLRRENIESVTFVRDNDLLKTIHDPLLSQLNLNESLDNRFLQRFLEAARIGKSQLDLSAVKSYEEDQSTPFNEQVFHLLNLLSGGNDHFDTLEPDLRSFLQSSLRDAFQTHKPQLCRSSLSTTFPSDRGCFLISLSKSANGNPPFMLEIKRIDVADGAISSMNEAVDSENGLTMIANPDNEQEGFSFDSANFRVKTGAEGNGKHILPQVGCMFIAYKLTVFSCRSTVNAPQMLPIQSF